MPTLVHCSVFALVAVTPSCLTAHVWSSYEPDWIHVVKTHAERRYESLGMLIGSANFIVDPGPALTWVYKTSAGDAARRLDLVPADAAAQCAATLLASPGITILHAGLETSIITDEYGVQRSSSLEIEYCVATGAFGRLLSSKMLDQHCVDSMHSIESQSMLGHSDWLSNLNLMMARCVGLSEAWRLEAWLVTDESLTPILAGSPIESLSQATSATLVLGRFRSPHGIQFGVMPSSIAALLASSNVQNRVDGICRHASRWHAVRAARQDHARDYHVLGPIVERVKSADVWTRATPNVDGSFFARLLVTPITLACDLAFGPGTLRLWQALSGDHVPIGSMDSSDLSSRIGGLR